MDKNKRAKLETMAIRGGTPNERAVAKSKLVGVVVKADESVGDTFEMSGVLIRYRRETKAYLRTNSLRHFLGHIADGVEFTNRSVPLCDHFGSGDFYVALDWMLANKLCVKLGSRYVVPRRSAVRDAWNSKLTEAKL